MKIDQDMSPYMSIAVIVSSIIFMKCSIVETQQQQQQQKRQKQPYKVIGIFYNCPFTTQPPTNINLSKTTGSGKHTITTIDSVDEATSNNNEIQEFNRIAQISNETVLELVNDYAYSTREIGYIKEPDWEQPSMPDHSQSTTPAVITKTPLKSPNFVYHSFTVCSHQDLLNLATSLFLHEEFLIPGDETRITKIGKKPGAKKPDGEKPKIEKQTKDEHENSSNETTITTVNKNVDENNFKDKDESLDENKLDKTTNNKTENNFEKEHNQTRYYDSLTRDNNTLKNENNENDKSKNETSSSQDIFKNIDDDENDKDKNIFEENIYENETSNDQNIFKNIDGGEDTPKNGNKNNFDENKNIYKNETSVGENIDDENSLKSGTFYNGNNTLINGDNITVYEQNILVLFAYIPESLSSALSEISSFTNFPLLCAPNSCDTRFPLFDIDKYATFLYEHLEKLQWYDVTLVSIVENQILYPYHKYYERSYAMLNATGRYCLKGRTFKASVSGKEGKLRTSQLSDDDFKTFLSIANNTNGTIVIFAGEVFLDWFLDELEGSPVFNEEAKNNSKKVARHSQYNFYQEKKPVKASLIPLITHDTGNVQGIAWMNLESWNRQQFYEAMTDNPIVDSSSGVSGNINIQRDYGGKILRNANGDRDGFEHKYHVWGKSFGIHLEMKVNFRSGMDYDSLRSIQCATREKVCKPGYFKTYGSDIVGSSSMYDMAHSRRCELCGVGQIKKTSGDSGCVPCPSGTVADVHHTSCIDPYTYQQHKMSTFEFVLVVLFVILGGLFTMSVFFVFIVKSTTPVVRSSDFGLSLLHLFALFSVFALSGILYTITTSDVMVLRGRCIGRNLIISVFYTLNVALVYTKTEKILAAFLSRVRVTSGEMKKAKAFQALTIIVFLSVTNGLLLTMYQQRRPGFAYNVLSSSQDDKDFEDQSSMVKIMYCNTAFHTDSLFVVLIAFQLVCLVQAFRGRNLPSPMNDALSMVYAILITTLAFTVYFPISYFQSTVDKEFIQLVVMLINCCVYGVLLYGRKLYVVLFRAEKNTRSYFQKECFTKISSSV